MGKGKYPWVRTALLYGAAAVLSLFSACKESGETENTAAPLVGGNRDEHGCIASAGYHWSRVQQRWHPSFRRRRPAAPGGGSAGQFGCSGRDGDLQRRFAPSRGASPRRGNIPCSGPENAAFGRICLEHRRRRYIQYPSGRAREMDRFPARGSPFPCGVIRASFPPVEAGKQKAGGVAPGLLPCPA